MLLIASPAFAPSFAEGFKNDGKIEYRHYKGDGLNNLWVFGDSDSDQSMNKLVNGVASTGHVWNGRNANGKNWVDYLGEISRIRTDERKNFAISGAKLGTDMTYTGTNTNRNPWGEKWSKMGIKNQIKLAKDNGLKFGKNDLVTIVGGINDYSAFFKIAYIPLSSTNAITRRAAFNPTTLTNVTDDANIDANIKTTTDTMITDMVANINNLKSMNAQNLFITPLVNTYDAPSNKYNVDKITDPAKKARWLEKSSKFLNDYNKKLAAELTKFSNNNRNISVYYVDTDAVYKYYLKNSELFGIPKANIGKACYDELYNAGKLKTGDNLNKNDCSKYISWDGGHVTSETQKMFANVFNSVIQIPRLHTMMVHNISRQTKSLLDLTKPSIAKLGKNNSKKLTFNSSAFQGQGTIGRSQSPATDGIMQQSSEQYSLSAQYAISPLRGVSVGYMSNKSTTNEHAKHQVTQSTTLLSLYGMYKIDKISRISTQGYYGYTLLPEIKRMIIPNKVAVSGNAKSHTLGANATYNRDIDSKTTGYVGLSHATTNIKGYREKAGLETGLGVKVGNINHKHTYLNAGIRAEELQLAKQPFGFNIGIEYDINNEIDKYTFTSINNSVPTHIKSRDFKQQALVYGVNTKFNTSKNHNLGLFLNGRTYKSRGSDFNLGFSHKIPLWNTNPDAPDE